LQPSGPGESKQRERMSQKERGNAKHETTWLHVCLIIEGSNSVDFWKKHGALNLLEAQHEIRGTKIEKYVR